MIWDEIRASAPAFRDPAVQVFRVPWSVGTADDTITNWWNLFPKNEGLGWIHAPFDRFVITGHDDNGCLVVEKIERETFPDETGEQRPGRGWTVFLLFRPTTGHPRPRLVGPPCGLWISEIDGKARTVSPSQMRLESNWAQEFANRMGVEVNDFTVAAAAAGADLQGMGPSTVDPIEAFAHATTGIVLTFMGLMSCQNVTAERRMPPRAARRRAQREGLELVSWHELVVHRPGTRPAVEGSARIEPGEPLALHWVRGHFKDYRTGGLFGSIRGVFWWSPHLAGRADRVALKGYAVKRGTR